MGTLATTELKTRKIDSPVSFVPEKNRDELFTAVAVFFAACLFLWPLRDFVSFNADDGFTLVAAERILRGQLPYRDYFTFIMPGSPYLMATWFKLFGSSYAVAKSVLLVYTGIFGAITYLLARRLYDRSTALFAAALLIWGCMPFRFLVLHNWDSTLFALITLYCAQRSLEPPCRCWSFFAGFAAASTCLIEQSRGAGLLMGLVIAAAIFLLQGRIRRWGSFANLCWAVTGLTVPLTVTFAYFASHHAIPALLNSLLWPASHYSTVNRVAFGWVPISNLGDLYSTGSLGGRLLVAFFSAPMLLISTLALLVLAATVYAIVLRYKSAPSTAIDLQVLGGSVFFGVFLAFLSTGRRDTHRLFYLAPLFVYLVPSILNIKHPRLNTLYRARPLVACLLLFSFGGFGMIPILNALRHTTRTETRRGTVRFGYNDEVIPYIERHVSEGEHLYVHPYQPLYNFLTGTANPTRFDFLQPGMATSDQYESAIRDLETDRTRFVLLDTTFAANKIPETWPSTPDRAIAVDPLADYIVRHYRACRYLNLDPPQVWSFYFMVRSDMQCPADLGKVTKP